jgi:hypothetical protein
LDATADLETVAGSSDPPTARGKPSRRLVFGIVVIALVMSSVDSTIDQLGWLDHHDLQPRHGHRVADRRENE